MKIKSNWHVLYSIIIPHKNIPDLLQRCLDSIPPKADAEILVVDDNSNPDLVDFEHFPGMNRPDVQCFFTKEGKGAGYARNVGLQHAEGKWLLFADADDFFHEDLWTLLDKWKDSDNDIVFFDTDSVDCATLQLIPKRIQYIDRTRTDALRYEWGVPYGKMIRHDLVVVNRIFFDEVLCANDAMFSLKTGYWANRISLTDDVLYCATVRPGSLRQTNDFEHLLCRLKVRMAYNRFIVARHLQITTSRNLEYVKSFRWKFGKWRFLQAFMVYLFHEPFKTMWKEIKCR